MKKVLRFVFSLFLFLVVFALSSFAQQTFFLPHIANGRFGDVVFRTTFILTNPSTSDASVTIRLRKSDSTAMTVNFPPLLGTGSEFRDVSLPRGSTLIFQTDGVGEGSVGTAKIESNSPNIGLSAIFSQFDSAGNLLTEAGVGASSPLREFSIPVDITGPFDTGVALFNVASSSLDLTLTLVDENGTQRGDPVRLSLGANNHQARFVSELFRGVSNFRGSLSVSSGVDRSVSAIALRIGRSSLTTLPVLAPQQDRFNLPHIANGLFGDVAFKTTFILTNPSDRDASVAVRLRKSDGTAMTVTLDPLGTNSEFRNVSLPRKSTRIYTTTGTGGGSTGTAVVESDNPSIVVSAIFSQFDAVGNLQTEAGVGDSPPLGQLTIPVDVTGPFDTGVALFNVTNSDINLTLLLVDERGVERGRVSLTLGANNHRASFVSQLFSGVSNFRGALSISSNVDSSISAVALRTGRPSLTTLPVTRGIITPRPFPAFGTLKIYGSGFDPANAAISVLLIPRGSGVPTAVPVFSATSTTLDVIVPPFVDASTGNPSSGTVDVQVVQVTASSLITSDVVSGPSIQAITAVPSSVRIGAITRAYMVSALAVLQTTAASPNATTLAAELNALTQEINGLLSAVDIVMNTGRSVALPTTNNQPFVLDRETLATMDKLILGYLAQFVPQIQTPPVGSKSQSNLAISTPCTPNTGDAQTDNFICSVQQYHQNLATAGAQAVQLGAKTESGFYLGFLGGWAASGLASAGAITAGTSKAFSLLWTVATSYITSYVTASPMPPLLESLLKVGAKLLDSYAFWGIPVASSALTGYNAYAKATTIATSVGTSPQGGVVLSSSTSNISPGNQSAFVFQGSGTSATANRVQVPPVQTTTSLTNVIKPPADVRQFDGAYSGSYRGTAFTEFGPQDVSGAVQFTVSNGTISVTVPGSGLGTLSSTGLVLVGSVAAEGASCTFGGKFDLTQSGRVLTGGPFSCTIYGGGIASGSWSAAR